jgi:hypothetical protein
MSLFTTSGHTTQNCERFYQILKDKDILTNEEVDFLQAMQDAVYFKCGGKRYYLKNGVH